MHIVRQIRGLGESYYFYACVEVITSGATVVDNGSEKAAMDDCWNGQAM